MMRVLRSLLTSRRYPLYHRQKRLREKSGKENNKKTGFFAMKCMMDEDQDNKLNSYMCLRKSLIQGRILLTHFSVFHPGC